MGLLSIQQHMCVCTILTHPDAQTTLSPLCSWCLHADSMLYVTVDTICRMHGYHCAFEHVNAIKTVWECVFILCTEAYVKLSFSRYVGRCACVLLCGRVELVTWSADEQRIPNTFPRMIIYCMLVMFSSLSVCSACKLMCKEAKMSSHPKGFV